MTPRIEELHALSLVFDISVGGTAVCSCGAEGRVIGKNRKRQSEKAYEWYAEHKRQVIE